MSAPTNTEMDAGELWYLARSWWREATSMGYPWELSEENRGLQDRCFERAKNHAERAKKMEQQP